MARAVLAALAALVGACSLDPDREVRTGLSGAIDSVVIEAMAEGPIAGMTVAVGRGIRVVHLDGYGYADLENELPATPGTVYHVGSITKQFTAAAIVQLVEDGRLRLDARLGEYLHDYSGPASEVTVEQLLNHTAGVKNYTTMERWWRTAAVEMTPAEMTSTFRNEPLDFPPGTSFSYSNSGYVLLGYLIERVSGQPYGGYLNEHLFAPHELTATRYCDDRALVPNRARGYQVVDGAFLHASHVSMSQAYAAGAVCSSALDLLT